MGEEQTPTQEASRQMAEAVFADPALRERFERMAKEAEEREPVPDDFAWLSGDERDEVVPIRRDQDFSQRAFDVVGQATKRHEDRAGNDR